MTFVVLGSKGVVGSELCSYLKANKEKVIEDIASAYHKEPIDKLMNKLKDNITLYHFAQISRVPVSINYPHETFLNNINSILNILEAIRKSHFNINLIFASSREVYGITENKRIETTYRRQALNPYAASKLASEALIESYANTYGINAKIVRLSSVYGSINDHPTRFVPRIILYALVAHVIPVYKNDVKKLFDFVYIDDVVYALYQISKHKMPLYNHIVTGDKTSLESVCLRVAFLTNAKLNYIDREERKTNIDQLRFVGKPHFKKYFKWQPINVFAGLNLTLKKYQNLPSNILYEKYKKAYYNDNTEYFVA